MRNSDIIIGGVKDGKPYFSDYHGIRNGKPKKDKIRNWKLKAFDEDEGFTTLVFSRKFETNDIHDMNITTSTMRVIWSFGESDDITYHNVKNRGTKSLYLLQKPQPDITMPKDGTKINFLMNMLPVPEKHTTYWCKSFIVPRFSERKHIIQKFTFPEQAGMSIGTSNDPVAFILEIHYDNPLNLKGHFDSSGIEMILTPAHRKYDAAMVEIGYYVDAKKSQFSQLIPPFVRNFRYFGYCLPNCQQHLRRSSFPRRWKIPGIKIFGVLLHSHLLGRQMALHHYRNGTILPPIVQDSSYDFNYQEMKFLHRPVTVLMGDILKVECVYDSTNIRNFTYGGQSTKEEMCLAYILYYPKINLTNCLSASESNQWKIEETGNLNFERFKNENVVKEFERKANSLNPYSSLWSICGQRGEIKFQGPHFTDHIPEDTSPISMFSPKKSVCKRRFAPRKPKTTTTKTEMFTSLLTSTTEESQGPVHHINVFLLTFPLIINYELTKLL
ncbi:DBH-like monooxygenase protein 1 homolog [Octopus vulgaris]|uniref:DBH-like monooxygenase protein 1 homolog n=1 Tax=Octopus vulgaris TaxID=6645 RepID=A0AA36F610_OCTVU|nr:DBH-like monooxygenase protein 1 homolog [Octopus vulgaris]